MLSENLGKQYNHFFRNATLIFRLQDESDASDMHIQNDFSRRKQRLKIQ